MQPQPAHGMLISIVIPTLSEAVALRQLLPVIQSQADHWEAIEYVVADASDDAETQRVAHAHGARVVPCHKANRAHQLNEGARASNGRILYFLHADVQPPKGFDKAIRAAVNEGYGAGSFRLRFDVPHWFLRFSAWFTRFSLTALRFGDQSLFVTRRTFDSTGGFNTNLMLMEDQELVKSLKKQTAFTVIPRTVVASARRYRQNGIFRQQGNYLLVYLLYKLGVSQHRLIRILR